MTRKDLINEVDSLMGGRAAEEVMLDDISTGASNDIARATEIVKSMIVDFGMSDKFRNMTLGKGVLGNRGGEPNLVREFSEETQNYIDEEIARIPGGTARPPGRPSGQAAGPRGCCRSPG